MDSKAKQILALDYERYVRLFILLLLAFFFLAHVGTSYLLHQAKNRLKGEQETRLLFLSQAAAEIVKPALAAANQPPKQLPPYTPDTYTFMALEDLRVKGNLYRLLCWDQKGRIFFSSFAYPPSSPPQAWEGLEKETQERILKGDSFISDFMKQPGGLILRASYFPIKDKKGVILGVIQAQEDSKFLRILEKFSPWIQGFILLAIVSLLVLSALFLQQVLRPFRQLSSAAKEARQLPSLKESKGERVPPSTTAAPALPQDEVEIIIKTFQEMIESLKAQEAELRRLHSHAEERAERFETLYRYILESMTSGVVGFDLEAKVTIINSWAQRLLGLDPSSAVGRACGEVFGEKYEVLLEQSLKKGVTHFRQELPFTHPRHGGILWLGFASTPLRDHKGQTVGATFLLTDLTEVKKLQEELKIKERFATIGEISAGIAHELRNSLGAIAGFAQLLSRRLPADAPPRAHIEDIQKEIGLLEKLINDFLTFARPLEPQPRNINWGDLIQETLKSLPLPWEEKKIKIILDGSLTGFNFQGDPFLLRQALHNLLLNAYQALEGGGQITLTAQRKTDYLGTKVILSIKDNGPGIPAGNRDKLFLPFFTTKKEGVGLGLAIAQKILLAHRGAIEVKSEEGRGAEFLLYLPEDLEKDR